MRVQLNSQCASVALILVAMTLFSTQAQISERLIRQEKNQASNIESFEDFLFNLEREHMRNKRQRLQEIIGEVDTIDEGFELVNSFFRGFQVSIWVPSYQSCLDSIQNLSHHANYTVMYWSTVTVDHIDTRLFNTTEFISNNLADTTGDCYSAGYNGYIAAITQLEQFPEGTDYLLAFMQNLIGNSIQFYNVYTAMESALNQNNLVEVWFQVGKILNLILDFEPIITASLESEDTFSEFVQSKKLGHPLLFAPQWWEIAWAILYNFIEASIGTESPSSQLCLGNYTYIETTNNEMLLQYDFFLYEEAGVNLQKIIRAIHPFTFSCYRTGIEYAQAGIAYTQTFEDPLKIAYNLVYHAGDIFDDVSEIIQIALNFNENNLQQWGRIGWISGSMLNSFFFNPEDYDPYVPPTLMMSKNSFTQTGRGRLSKD